jgi:hypothetical protein
MSKILHIILQTSTYFNTQREITIADTI